MYKTVLCVCAPIAFERRPQTGPSPRRSLDTFVPMIAEACGGGWGHCALAAFRAVAARSAARTATSAEGAEAQLVERVGLVLQRECARAVFRRMPDAGST